jgi:hypothetical protein
VWIVTAWPHIAPEVIVRGFKKCCISSAVDGLMALCCGMAVKRMGILGVSVRNMKTLLVRVETVMLFGNSR